VIEVITAVYIGETNCPALAIVVEGVVTEILAANTGEENCPLAVDCAAADTTEIVPV